MLYNIRTNLKLWGFTMNSTIGQPNTTFTAQNQEELLEAGVQFGGVVRLGPSLASKMVSVLEEKVIVEGVDMKEEVVTVINGLNFTLKISFALLREYFSRQYSTIYFYYKDIEKLISLFDVDPNTDPNYKL